jgi:hypothetical protein
VAEIMGDPRGEELSQGHGAECRVLAFECHLRVSELEVSKSHEVLLAQRLKLVEQLAETLSLALAELREAIVRLEAAVRVRARVIQSVRSPWMR